MRAFTISLLSLLAITFTASRLSAAELAEKEFEVWHKCILQTAARYARTSEATEPAARIAINACTKFLKPVYAAYEQAGVAQTTYFPIIEAEENIVRVEAEVVILETRAKLAEETADAPR